MLTACAPKDDINRIQYIFEDWPESRVWEEEPGDCTSAIDISNQMAVEIANIIFKQAAPYHIKDTGAGVTKVENSSIVIVSRVHNDYMTLQGEINLAIDTKDGRIIKMWATE